MRNGTKINGRGQTSSTDAARSLGSQGDCSWTSISRPSPARWQRGLRSTKPAPTPTILEVDPKTKHVLQDKSDFRSVNPIGLVPTLRTDDGVILTENAAILQYVAERFPDANISAKPGIERSRLQQWLCFIGTELHKGLFVPLLDAKAPADAKAYALQKNLSRLDYVNKHLEGREFVLDHFSVADAYLVTILNWTQAVPAIDLAKWPAIKAYYDRVRQRPSVMKACDGRVHALQGRTRPPQGGLRVLDWCVLPSLRDGGRAELFASSRLVQAAVATPPTSANLRRTCPPSKPAA